MKDRLRTNIFPKILYFLCLVAMISVVAGCKNKRPGVKDIVRQPEELDDRVKNNLRDLMEYAIGNGGRIADTLQLRSAPALQKLYESKDYQAFWSQKGHWLPVADSLYHFIEQAKLHGLFPSDYFYSTLTATRQQIVADSMASKDAALWSRTDLLFSDAFLAIAQHLHRGRLPYDSLSVKKDSGISEDFYPNLLQQALSQNRIAATLEDLEPKLAGYVSLKQGIPSFLDSADLRSYTYLSFPFADSVQFYLALQKRLYEEKLLDTIYSSIDTAKVRQALTRYQTTKKLKTTGRPNENTVRRLNDTDSEKYKRIALSLDKYKLMADTLPSTYVWVNLPAFELTVVDSDTVALQSRVIVGAPKTRTPELSSDISNFITYPQWTVPYSIIFKEMLPAIKKDTNYLKKQNLMVVDKNDSVISPSTIKWSKLSKSYFPYQIKQRQGDDNSLGVMKFNFRNRYSVYLHDTNARWLFSRSMRSLSHGCVRVQNWEQLAHFLVRNDTVRYSADTLASWIARQEKHVVSGFRKVPLFIRYFTCEGKDGRISFYDDIYAQDKALTEKYFSKSIN